MLSPPPSSPAAACIEDFDPAHIVIRTHVQAAPRHMDPHLRRARMVAVGLIALAGVGLIPLLVSSFLTDEMEATRWERWAVGVFWMSMLEAYYAVFVWQLADRSAVRFVSWMTLLVAGVYAMAAAVRIFAANGNRVTAFWDLDGNVFSTTQELLWCFLMVMLSGAHSYLAGTWSAKWAAVTERSSAAR